MLSLAFAFFFALALFCSGQSAGITATLAGQVIGEGFMNWKISVSVHIAARTTDSLDNTTIARSPPCPNPIRRDYPFRHMRCQAWPQ